jgi:hypothetical protein
MRMKLPIAGTQCIDTFALWMGSELKMRVCVMCGLLILLNSPVMSKVDMLPGKAIVKMGMMPVIPTPEMESFALHKHTWFKKPAGVTSYKILRTGEVMDE